MHGVYSPRKWALTIIYLLANDNDQPGACACPAGPFLRLFDCARTGEAWELGNGGSWHVWVSWFVCVLDTK